MTRPPQPPWPQRLRNLAARPLLRNVAKVALGNLGGNALNLATILLLGRVLQAEYGILGTLQTVMLLLAQLADLGLNLTLVKFYREEHDVRRNPAGAEALLRALFWLRLALVGGLAALGAALAGPLAAQLNLAGHAGLLRLACAGALANSLWMFAQAAMQARERFTEYATQTFANHALRAVLIGALWLAGRLTVTTGLLVILLVPLAGFLASAARWPRLFWTAPLNRRALAERLREIFAFSKWVFASFLLATLSTHAGVMQMAALARTADVAVYRMAEQLSQAVALVTAAVATVLLPRLASTRKRSEMARIYRKLPLLVPVLGLVWLVVFLGFKYCLPVVLGRNFSPSIPVLGWLTAMQMLGLIINPLSYLCYAFGRSHWVTWMGLVSTPLYIAANYHAIRHYGALGPAYSGMAVHLISLILVCWFNHRLYRMAEP